MAEDLIVPDMMSKLMGSAVIQRGYNFYLGAWNTITSRYPIGTNVFEKEWDVLILLDTCRVDALQSVASEYDFLTNVESLVSVGSTSSEWIANTFREEYLDVINNTAYVTGNGHSQRVLSNQVYPDPQYQTPGWPIKMNFVHERDLLLLDQPWAYVEEDEPGHVSADAVTDRTISVGREYDWDRIVVHYSQPHSPYVSNAIMEDRELFSYEDDPFPELREGNVSKDVVWEAYISELHGVLESVETLLKNIDAPKVAISADHGEAFGEWGMYGHVQGMLHPDVKIVPWAETSAEDTHTVEPEIEHSDEEIQSMKEQLEALGYK
jgi:hypothetical protein